MQQACERTLKLPEHDLAAAKTRTVSQFVHARETYQGIAGQLGRFTMVYGDPNYGQRYIAAIETLSVESLCQAVGRYLLPECANLALLAPQQAVLPEPSALLSWMQERRATSFMGQRLSPPGADVDVLQLPGGSRLVVQTDRKTPLVSVRVLCDGGQRAEQAGKEGLARLLTSVWDRGTVVRGAGEIEREIDRLGAVLSASSDLDTVQLGARFLKETFADGLDLFFDILTAPSFAEQEVMREQADQLRDLDSLKEHRSNFAFQHFLQTFYGSHPYNHLALGLPAGLASVGREELLAFHRALLQPHKMVFAVVGDIATEDVLDSFERLAPETLLETQPVVAQAGSALPTRHEMVEQVVELPGQQTHIVWGFPTVTISHPDRYALRVLDTILGGQGGRLFVELRDRKSLAYTVTSFDAYPVEQGFFALYIACTPDKEKEALEAFERIIQDVQNAGVSQEELNRAQTYLEGVVDIGLQSSSQRTAVYGMGELHSSGWDAYQQYVRVVQQMAAAEVQRVAQTYLDPSRSVRLILRAI
jgi:zinc protease